MAESRKIKLVLKDHACARIGELASWESFDCISRVNDVGEAVLVAGWGASRTNDARLDALDEPDLILEAYIKPPGHTSFLLRPAWAGFLRDRKIAQDGPVKVGTFTFKDYNHLLARRVIKPPDDASHDEEHDTTANIMRNMVRSHAGPGAETGREFPGLLVEDNDAPDVTGLYSEQSALVFGNGLPEWIRVNCLYEWNGNLYLGTETQRPEGSYAAIFRSAEGTTWEQVYDGSPGVYAEGVTGIHCFAEFDGALWVGCSQDWEREGAILLRTVDGNDWTQAATFPNLAGIWSLCEFDGNFYAGTTGWTPFMSETWLWVSPDGFNWTSAAAVPVAVDCPGRIPWHVTHWGECTLMACESMKVWTDRLYLGTQRKVCKDLSGDPHEIATYSSNHSGAFVYQTEDGVTFTKVFSTGSAHGVLSLEDFGDYLYAGTGRTRWSPFICIFSVNYGSGGRLYRTIDGISWEQVFGAFKTKESSEAITSIIQTANLAAESVLWMSTGKLSGGQAKIWQSIDGENWINIAQISIIPYQFPLALADFLGEHYCSTGCYAKVGEWQPDHGDVWRIVPSETDIADDSMMARWTSLLEKLQEKANNSGLYDFGIVGYDSFLYCFDEVQSFQFQVRSPQWGVDRRWDGTQGLVFQIERGNMMSVAFSEIRGTRPTFLYVLGASSGEERALYMFPNLVAMGGSPWGRIEGVVDAQSIDSPNSISSIGWSEMEQQGPYKSIEFQACETNWCYYKADNEDAGHPGAWGLGDIVTAYFANYQAACKIDEVAISAGNGDAVYDVRPTLRVLEIAEVDVVYTVYLATKNDGLYRSTDFTFEAGVDPTWEHLGQEIGIDYFAIDRTYPETFQAMCADDTIYVRRPVVYEDEDWHEVFNRAAAETLVGTAIGRNLTWVEINPQRPGHLYTMGCESYNSLGKKIWVFKSTNYGETWTATIVYSGIVRDFGAIWAGNAGGSYSPGSVLYISYNYGSGGSARIAYSIDEGATWATKDSMGNSIWLARALVDPTNQDVSYAGDGINGPELAKSTIVNGSYAQIDGALQAGISIHNVCAVGWVSAFDGQAVRTYRNTRLYHSDDAGVTWGEAQPTPITARGLWAADMNPNCVVLSSYASVGIGEDFNAVQATADTGKTWMHKSGVLASQAGAGGGNSVPYDCGGTAENGLFMFIAR